MRPDSKYFYEPTLERWISDDSSDDGFGPSAPDPTNFPDLILGFNGDEYDDRIQTNVCNVIQPVIGNNAWSFFIDDLGTGDYDQVQWTYTNPILPATVVSFTDKGEGFTPGVGPFEGVTPEDDIYTFKIVAVAYKNNQQAPGPLSVVYFNLCVNWQGTLTDPENFPVTRVFNIPSVYMGWSWRSISADNTQQQNLPAPGGKFVEAFTDNLQINQAFPATDGTDGTVTVAAEKIATYGSDGTSNARSHTVATIPVYFNPTDPAGTTQNINFIIRQNSTSGSKQNILLQGHILGSEIINVTNNSTTQLSTITRTVAKPADSWAGAKVDVTLTFEPDIPNHSPFFSIQAFSTWLPEQTRNTSNTGIAQWCSTLDLRNNNSGVIDELTDDPPTWPSSGAPTGTINSDPSDPAALQITSVGNLGANFNERKIFRWGGSFSNGWANWLNNLRDALGISNDEAKRNYGPPINFDFDGDMIHGKYSILRNSWNRDWSTTTGGVDGDYHSNIFDNFTQRRGIITITPSFFATSENFSVYVARLQQSGFEGTTQFAKIHRMVA
jgi:hypothetical protein